ncbi:MAG: hypothetical protein ACWGNS_14700 [Burkholderiales bacterium]
MRKMLIPIALAATLACGFAQAQERERGDRRADGGGRSDATQMRRGDGSGVRPTRTATNVDRVDTRQARQSDRIRNGVRSGDLTRREASTLRSEQRGIRRMERHARADGVVTPREGRRLERAQDRASRHINQQRHDRQQRFSGSRGHDRGRAAYGRGHNRGNHYAYGRGHNRGNHYAYGHRYNRGKHYAYGHRYNRGNRHAYGHRYNHRPQFASRGRFGRR